MGETEKAPKKSFFAGMKSEFSKITWPDKESVTKQTIAVICTSVVLGAVIALLDLLFQYGVDFLTTL